MSTPETHKGPALAAAHVPATYQPAQGWVYFIQGGPFVKIGWSKNPSGRKAQLGTGNPYELKIVGEIPGTELDERSFHMTFAEFRAHGEWFHAHPQILSLAQWAANYDKKLGVRLVQQQMFQATAEAALAQTQTHLAEWQAAHKAERSARVAAEVKAIEAERRAKEAEDRAEALFQHSVYTVAESVYHRMNGLREEFFRAKDQTDDHEGFAAAMEAEVASCFADVMHAIDRCSCGYSFDENQEPYLDPDAHCGAGE